MKQLIILLIAVNTGILHCRAQQQMTGPNSVCIKQAINLKMPAGSASGGTWSSSNTQGATVAGTLSQGAIIGVVTGVAPGTATISYTDPNSLTTSKTTTVNATPWILLNNSLKGFSFPLSIGGTDTLSSNTTNGQWALSNGNASFTSAATGTMVTITGVSPGMDTMTLQNNDNGCYDIKPVVVAAPAASQFYSTDTAIFDIENWHKIVYNDTYINHQVTGKSPNSKRTAFIFPANVFDTLIHSLNCTHIVAYLAMNDSGYMNIYFDGAWQTGPNDFNETTLCNSAGLPVMIDRGIPCPVCGNAGNIHLNSPIPSGGGNNLFIYSFVYNNLNNKAGSINYAGFKPYPIDTTVTYSYAAMPGWSLDSVNIDGVTFNQSQFASCGCGSTNTFQEITSSHYIGVAFDPILTLQVTSGQGTGTMDTANPPLNQVTMLATAPYNSSKAIYMKPSGNNVLSLTLDGQLVPGKDISGPVNGVYTYTLSNIQWPHTLIATFVLPN